MATANRSTVVGVFEDRYQADKAVTALQSAGFRQDQIGVAMRHADGTAESGIAGHDEDTHAGSGAAVGAMTGLGLGALAGLGVLSGIIPVIGPAIAAGTLGIVLSNAAAGAGIAGLAGALVGAGLPEHEATYYHDEFEAGRAIVSVDADGRSEEASTILHRYGAYDMNTKGSATATTKSAPVAKAVSTPQSNVSKGYGTTGSKSDTIEVKEERLHAEKTPVEAGEVRVRKEVHTETKHLEVPVKHEEVVIERTPVHGRASSTGISADSLRGGEEIRIPLSEEQVHVTKEAVVTEQVKVGKRTVEETQQVTGQVRKEEIKIEKTGDVDVRSRGK